jgi:hypothetical protein
LLPIVLTSCKGVLLSQPQVWVPNWRKDGKLVCFRPSCENAPVLAYLVDTNPTKIVADILYFVEDIGARSYYPQIAKLF